MTVIYVDDIRYYGKKGLWCHMWADEDDTALDHFAARIGLEKAWAQLSHGVIVGRFYHYDLKPSKRELALKNGAVYLPLTEYIKRKKEDARPES